jgi:uncharacterized FAD-dependent dehydrogenase
MISQEIENVISTIKKAQVDCRQKHVKIQSPNVNKAYCEYCENYAIKRERNLCDCCGHGLKRFYNNYWLNSVINKGLKDFKDDMEKWETFPIPEKMMAEFGQKKSLTWKDRKELVRHTPYIFITFKYIVYELPIKWLVFAHVNTSDKPLMLKLMHEKIIAKGITLRKY